MELASPITIYWDLPAEPADNGMLRRLCADIAACRPLMLQVTCGGDLPGEGTVAVLEEFSGTPVAVSLTVPVAAFHESVAARAGDLKVKELLLSAESVADFQGMRGAFRESSPAMGISFPVTRANWRQLPSLVAFCREEGVTRLVLPMQRLYGGEAPFFIDRAEQDELTASLAAEGGADGLNVTIHDPFLWRAFNPGVPFPQGGCQAANTMIAIAPDGGVYPCPTLPVRLGTLGAMSLREIIASQVKRAFRFRLRETPEECIPCREADECRGGCLGRAFAVHGSLDGADPACK
ncbi:GeoRSP system SPASM domain protein [Geobacter benzoatilyticus]|uniref:GeoRSP system SPASM domain protein n=1 Tax=Geobacter benzoatilyticus TaxID=2815309 RepID=A0ABX7PZC4_9BACT|nr:GeoRSP system SPASM domain protein [Geobacter benzoatilyticus]QSV44226.1 GeoRSP system SPASM domain protein [Geobacter benzoatilyticus]